MIQRLQSISSWITVTRLPIGQYCKAAGRTHTNPVIGLHQYHSTTLSRHHLRLLLENGQGLLAHVGGHLRESIDILHITFAQLDRTRWIHPMMHLIYRVKLLRYNLHLTIGLHLLIKLIYGGFTNPIHLLHKLPLELLAIIYQTGRIKLLLLVRAHCQLLFACRHLCAATIDARNGRSATLTGWRWILYLLKDDASTTTSRLDFDALGVVSSNIRIRLIHLLLVCLFVLPP